MLKGCDKSLGDKSFGAKSLGALLHNGLDPRGGARALRRREASLRPARTEPEEPFEMLAAACLISGAAKRRVSTARGVLVL